MKRLIVFGILCICWPGLVRAAEQPLLRAELDSKVAVPGQVLLLEVTLLVPTWMPAPPVFPNFEIPNVRVQLPEGASGPAMETVEGETWSGVTRAYQLSPMVVGQFDIPSQVITVTYADPETSEPKVVEMRMDPITFEGRAPVGAEDLDPFIAASSLNLEQSIDGDPTELEAGSAFTRVVTARLSGASPFFLPPLVLPFEARGLATYPKEPEFIERQNRGETTGSRVESVTYIAESGGRFEAPAIRLRWWNLETQEIEVAEIPPLEVIARGPSPLVSSEISADSFLLWGLSGVAIVVIAGGFVRFGWPRYAEARRRRKKRRLASESFAFDEVIRALDRRELGEVMRATEIWSARLAVDSESDRARFFAPLERLCVAIYGDEGRMPSRQEWSSARSELAAIRSQHLTNRRKLRRGHALPALNPG